MWSWQLCLPLFSLSSPPSLSLPVTTYSNLAKNLWLFFRFGPDTVSCSVRSDDLLLNRICCTYRATHIPTIALGFLLSGD
ncbi:hypothetical protein P175DRAFT_0501655 [Aspergillus ochraceoroseus IBT 24754]|uniref:Secreted protein n=1 Tax=Aspergillus ochraceoroseus IBT 24754 TaxID=1392256 RepID=A0A2T5LXK9_9EURO|nr:uncharacterized protein P175DRAFT_0501655 [Aspergillus ochraceoroseus IBT 24754]PTU21025.1 hypothetical protein P175DRAFT_0501655 [Aspergillus ochraceoroseus IBT 24754]